jgi:glycosyltransferase involved in cell wall biosynthesis
MPHPEPLVSVIIPTINRPALVVRAVRTALDQTLKALEVIVVVDGPDDTTLRALREIRDPRLRIRTLPQNRGSGVARKVGIDMARGNWVAFLDDDDEWLPQKLAIQIDTAQRSTFRYPIVTCRVIVRTDKGHGVWPRRLRGPNEHLSEYLFRQRGLLEGPVLAPMVPVPTILTARELLREVPLRDVHRFDDVDWLLRVGASEEVGLESVPTCEPLAICHAYTADPIGISTAWRCAGALDFIQSHRDLVTPQAYAFFLLTRVAGVAAEGRDYATLMHCLRGAFRDGAPTLVSIVIYCWIALVPSSVRRRVARWFVGRHWRTRQRGPG